MRGGFLVAIALTAMIAVGLVVGWSFGKSSEMDDRCAPDDRKQGSGHGI